MCPRVVFVLGKGGVGRSTIAAALGLGFAGRGERVLVVQWALADAISRWFDGAPAGFAEREIAPNLATMNFSTDASLREYFVDHLHLRAFYRAVISNRHIRSATRAAPGIDELMFLGRITWLATRARDERGWSYDRVIVDAPAMGHGASLFAIPHATRALGLGGLLATECARVDALLADPARSAAIVVATPEELAVEETLEFWPRIARDLGRPPIAVIVNRSARSLGALPIDARACPWFARAAETSAPATREALEGVYARLARRGAREASLRERLEAPAIAVDDALLVEEAPSPHTIAMRAAEAIAPLWSAR